MNLIMKNRRFSWFALVIWFALGYSQASYAIDQCDTTQQCQARFSDATDCRDSQSSDSVCMCGARECDTTGGSNEGPSGFTFAADEGATVRVQGTVDIAYGANGKFNYLRNRRSNVACNNDVFGDPNFGTKKACYIKPVSGGGSSSSSSSGGAPQDQCNTTQQCQVLYGNRATDCANSASDESVCMCGSSRCDGQSSSSSSSSSSSNSSSSSSGGRILLETGGLVAIEAESYSSIDNKSFNAKWYETSRSNTPNVRPDPDGNHANGASGSKYLEILPDTRVTHDDPLIRSGRSSNFFAGGGSGPTLNYRVYFNTPGTYTVWLRAFSTGSEDNGAHVGINGQWPASGERVQWCQGKNSWTWSSAQRTDANHCGVGRAIKLNVPSRGIHNISVSMREDGFELDKIIMAKDSRFTPSGASIEEKIYNGNGGGEPGQKIGKFDTEKDFLLACYDNLPDVDDLQSMAALGTILRDPRFAAVDYFAVVGCRGNQPRQFKLITNSSELADLAFGSGNWARALNDQVDRRGQKIWNDAVNAAVDRAMPKLRSGGQLWIPDAGQSDFSADVVREIVRRDRNFDTKKIHVVQHSQWNQDVTSVDDLNYLRSKVDYKKIPDGNDLGNGTPGYKTSRGNNWQRILNNPQVDDMWREARRLGNEWNGIKNGHTNHAIKDGGFDFSDTSEVVYIFEMMDEANDVDAFFDEFL